ncbi:hypothetical protein GP486_007886 [Trichoglossum hirsutum]|uniref:Uncharacterized protein n=1 Tax=Trichoglossum hirsutum TaxID=265104 RepID=A0A9P8L296_9PEZI|nr:hypothetical protein GP486_007886 [Trichoglossum hirsutum]
MAPPSTESPAARVSQTSRSRPVAVVPIVPAVPLPARAKSKHGAAAAAAAAAATMGLPVLETGQNGEVTQLDGSLSSSLSSSSPSSLAPPAHGVAVIGPESTVADVEVNKDHVGDLSEVTTENGSEEQAKVADAESSSTKSMEQSVPLQYYGYQFPPPFHPHGQQSAPSSAESPTGHQFLPSYSIPPLQHPHPQPGANGVIFGGYPDSSSSSPALQYPPHPPPGFMDPGFQPAFHPLGHQHRLSEPRVPFMNRPGNPSFSHRPDVYLPPRPGFPYAPQYHGRMPSFAPPEGYSPFPPGTPVGGEGRGFLPPQPPPPQVQGARAPSGSSSYDRNSPNLGRDSPQMQMQGGHQITASSVATSEKGSHYQSESGEFRGEGGGGGGSGGGGQSSFFFPDQLVPKDDDGLGGLLNYIESQFDRPDFSDYTLELQHADGTFRETWHVHGILIARSPTLKAVMGNAASSPDGGTEKTLKMETSDRFLSPEAFTKAIQRLYGLSLLPSQEITTLGPPSSRSYRSMDGQFLDVQTIQKQMKFALAYAAAGCLLRITEVARRGIEAAGRAIIWETLEDALDFAMDGGLSAEWTSGDAKSSTSVSSSSASSSRRSVSAEGSRAGSASASSLDSPRDTPETLSLGTSGGTYAPYADSLLQQVMNFIEREFPLNFVLDSTAPQFSNHPRLPMEINVKPRTNPRLSSMKFGDNPTEDDIKRSNLSTTVLSSTLLSIPFPLLKHILESTKLGGLDGWASATLRQKVARDVIDERERRRREARGQTNISKEERSTNSKTWENVGWEESVVIEYSGQAGGVELKRRWKGFSH